MQELSPTNVIGNRNCNKKLKKHGLRVTPKMVCTFDKNSGVCNVSNNYYDNCYYLYVVVIYLCSSGRYVMHCLAVYGGFYIDSLDCHDGGLSSILERSF